MFDLSGQQVLFRIATALFIAGTHGYAMAVIARLMGDPGPGYDGRQTLNPLQHGQLLGFVSLVLFRIGWTKPMIVDPKLLRGGNAGLFVVVLGSLAATLAIAAALWALRPWLLTTFTGTSAIQQTVLWFESVATISTTFVIFNLIPIPPFTAGLLLAGYAPRLYAMLVPRVVLVSVAFAAILFLADRADLLSPLFRSMSGWFFQ